MKVLVIDDHALFRDGILLVLDGLNTPITSFEAGSYESAKVIMDDHLDLDLILLDLGLPGISYLDALIAIKKQSPDTLIVVLSGTEDYQMVDQVLQYGAHGYIPKSSPVKIMLYALQLVIAGGIYVPPEILHKKLSNEASKTVNHKKTEHNLTPRQYEVLQQLAKGFTNKKIGTELLLTESTVRAHVAAILKTFGVSNRTQAVQTATQNNWIKLDNL